MFGKLCKGVCGGGAMSNFDEFTNCKENYFSLQVSMIPLLLFF